MKRVILLMLVFCTFLSAKGQYASKPNGISENKVSPVFKTDNPGYRGYDEPGLRMKRTGTTLTVFGAILFVSGAALASTADELYYSSNTTNGTTVEEGDPKGGLGVVMVAAGTGMMVPGIIFWSKGARKHKRYIEDQKATINIKGSGLSVRFTF